MVRFIAACLTISMLVGGCSATVAPSTRIATEYPNACNDSTMLALAKRPMTSLSDREFEYLLQRSSDCSNLRAAAMIGEATAAGANAQADTQMTIFNTALLFCLAAAVGAAIAITGK